MQKYASQLRWLLRCHIWKMKSTSKEEELHITLETVTGIYHFERDGERRKENDKKVTVQGWTVKATNPEKRGEECSET